MSHIVITVEDKEFKILVSQAYAEGYKKAIKDTTQKSQLDDDLLTEEEALEVLKCGKAKLAKLRASKSIEFYTHTRPFHYSRESIEKYIST